MRPSEIKEMFLKLEEEGRPQKTEEYINYTDHCCSTIETNKLIWLY